MPDIVNMTIIILVLIFWLLIIGKLIAGRCAPVKVVNAKVADKYTPCTASKYPAIFKQKRYIVVFEVRDKKLSFNVSEFSYGNYKIGDKGTLKYKGSKIIDFK